MRSGGSGRFWRAAFAGAEPLEDSPGERWRGIRVVGQAILSTADFCWGDFSVRRGQKGQSRVGGPPSLKLWRTRRWGEAIGGRFALGEVELFFYL